MPCKEAETVAAEPFAASVSADSELPLDNEASADKALVTIIGFFCGQTAERRPSPNPPIPTKNITKAVKISPLLSPVQFLTFFQNSAIMRLDAIG